MNTPLLSAAFVLLGGMAAASPGAEPPVQWPSPLPTFARGSVEAILGPVLPGDAVRVTAARSAPDATAPPNHPDE